jgi:hypothetical protein
MTLISNNVYCLRKQEYSSHPCIIYCSKILPLISPSKTYFF